MYLYIYLYIYTYRLLLYCTNIVIYQLYNIRQCFHLNPIKYHIIIESRLVHRNTAWTKSISHALERVGQGRDDASSISLCTYFSMSIMCTSSVYVYKYDYIGRCILFIYHNNNNNNNNNYIINIISWKKAAWRILILNAIVSKYLLGVYICKI